MDNETWEAVRCSILKRDGITLIRSFLDAGLDVNALNNSGRTMLCCAAEWNNMKVLEFLLQNGADGNILNRDGTKPPHLAAFNGHKDVVEFFLGAGIHVECPDINNETMLHYACAGGRLEIVKYLVTNECDINSKTSNGMTPLQSAVLHGELAVVMYLVESGADVAYRSHIGFGVFHYCAFLVKRPSNMVDYLIQKGCDPNDRDNFNRTPLHYAVNIDNLEMIECLLNAGADFNIENTHGETPFSLFIQRPFCLAGIELFLEKGAYFQSEDYNFLIANPLLKEGILQDVKLCTQSVVNKFNHGDLPKLYEKPEVAQWLPAIEKMKIASNSKKKRYIAESVKYEIQTKGYCNLLNVRPIDLNSLCPGFNST